MSHTVLLDRLESLEDDNGRTIGDEANEVPKTVVSVQRGASIEGEGLVYLDDVGVYLLREAQRCGTGPEVVKHGAAARLSRFS